MRRLIIVGAMVVGSLYLGTFTLAAEVLDQQNDVTPSGTADSTSGGFLEQAQTFTVGVTGTLSRIAVQINFPGFGSSGNAILNVYKTASGVPTGASLGSAMIPSSLVPSGTFAFQSFDLSLSGILVHTGDVLAYGISSDVNSTFFVRSTSDRSTYAGGLALFRGTNPTGAWMNYTFSHDYGFQTYVVTTPTGLPGDFNHNGVVDAADYATWRDHMGDANESALNGNGDGQNGVDQGDFALWRTHFGASASPAAAAAVPEPMSLLLLLSAIGWAKAVTRQR